MLEGTLFRLVSFGFFVVSTRAYFAQMYLWKTKRISMGINTSFFYGR